MIFTFVYDMITTFCYVLYYFNFSSNIREYVTSVSRRNIYFWT